MSFYCDLRVLGKKLASRLATQRKFIRKSNLRPLATTCRSVWPRLQCHINKVNPDYSNLQAKRKLVRKIGDSEKWRVKLRCSIQERETTFGSSYREVRTENEGSRNRNCTFYDNSTNSRALIGKFLSSISGQTNEFIMKKWMVHRDGSG